MANPKWKNGEGATGRKGDYQSFKNPNGPMAWVKPTWAWLRKKIDRCEITVRWWQGSDGHNGTWERADFKADDLKGAKAKALAMAKEHGFGAEVFGTGWAYSSRAKGMDRVKIFEFGEYESTRAL